MSDVDDDKLPDDLAAWLGPAKELHGPPPDVRARMTSRLLAALPTGPGGGGSGARPEPPASPAPPTRMPQIPAWIAAATFVLGVGAGALATSPHATKTTPNAETSTTPSPSAALSVGSAGTSAAPSETSATLRPEDLPTAATGALAAPKPTVTTPRTPGGGDLSAERAVLDVARTALGRGDPAHALASTDEHARRFPRGALSEEREAIAVQALAQSGRADEARSRALRFKKDHPESILLPAVLAAGAVP